MRFVSLGIAIAKATGTSQLCVSKSAQVKTQRAGRDMSRFSSSPSCSLGVL